MKYAFILFGLLCLGAHSPMGHGAKVADVKFTPQLFESSLHPKMVLNGASLRELYLLVDSYAGALYLEQPSQVPTDILNSYQHKRMVFHILMKKVSARRIANALSEALVLNITEQAHNRLHGDIQRFLGFFDGSLLQGDEVIFHYVPSKGTLVTVSDEDKGWIMGHEFMNALLKVWIGEHPVSREFKEQILGKSPD